MRWGLEGRVGGGRGSYRAGGGRRRGCARKGREKAIEAEVDTEIVRAKYVVVREAAGLSFEGDSYAHDFVLADVYVD